MPDLFKHDYTLQELIDAVADDPEIEERLIKLEAERFRDVSG